MVNNKIFTALLLLLVMIFSILIRLPYLQVPLERDEGGYAYIAWRMEQGELPYRDIFDNKPPLIYFIYLLIFKVFGYSLGAIHFFLMIWVLAEAVLLYFFCRQLFPEPAIALIAAAIFSLLAGEPGVFGCSANTEIFMLLPIIGSYIFLLKHEEGQRVKWLVICGLLNGIAFMIKPVGLYNFAGIIIYLSYKAFKECGLKCLAKKILFLAAGFILMPALLFVYFWSQGAAAEFIYGTFGYNLDYLAVGGSWLDQEVIMTFWRRFSFILRSDLFFWLICLYAFVSGYRTEKKIFVLLSAWLVMSSLGVAAGKRFFPHYFLQLMPPVAIGAAWGLRRLFDSKSLALKLSLISLVIFVPLQGNYQYLFKYTPEEISTKIYTVNPFVEARPIAAYVAAQTSPYDTIAILGSEPEILYYARRKSASKYIYFHHILWRKDPAEVLAAQHEAVREIENNRPRYIIAVNINASVGKHEDTPEYLFAAMRQMIRQEYSVHGYVLMKRGSTSYVFGEEQIRKHAAELRLEQPQVILYRRNKS
jgi:4-amino-4-deoxy-L-arabinose transferase-like glycosyltransferase